MAATVVRRRMTGEDRRGQILDVTHAIVEAEGFHAATPARIAAAAGVTRPVLYQQFGDPAGVFVALIDREGERAAAQFAEAIAQEPGTGETSPFLRTFEGVLRALDAHPATWRLFMFPPEGAPPELHRRLARAEDDVRAYLRGLLVGTFPHLPDPDYTARVVHAAGRELLRLRLTDPEGATRERLRAMVENLGAWVRP